jgi:hypothetical protein
MTPLVILDSRLGAIRSFFDRVSASVNADYDEVIQRAKAGRFRDRDDEANALFGPFTSEQIAIRAVLSELNALVESELQALAIKPLVHRAPSSEPGRLVWDLKRDALCKLVETYYAVSIADLPGSGAVEEIRQKINAYKHRGGVRDPRRDCDIQYFPEKFELDREQTRFYIQAVRDFLQALGEARAKGST